MSDQQDWVLIDGDSEQGREMLRQVEEIRRNAFLAGFRAGAWAPARTADVVYDEWKAAELDAFKAKAGWIA